MEVYHILVLFVCAALFGVVARNLTKDEKNIYKKKQYFPLFKIILSITSLLSFSMDKDIFIVLLSILTMVIFWDLEFKIKKGIKRNENSLF